MDVNVNVTFHLSETLLGIAKPLVGMASQSPAATQPRAPSSAAEKTPEEKTAKPKKTPRQQEAEEPIDPAEMRAVAATKEKGHVKALLDDFGYTNISGIPEPERAEFFKLLKGL